jgi:hypothetical protein
MLLSVFVVSHRLQGTPAAVAALPWRYRASLAVAAFVGESLASKAPFLTASTWFTDGKTILTGLAGGYLAVEFVKWRLGIRVKDRGHLRVAARRGRCGRPTRLLLQRLLLRRRDGPALMALALAIHWRLDARALSHSVADGAAMTPTKLRTEGAGL